MRTAEIRKTSAVTVSGPSRTATGPQGLELDGATAWVRAGWGGETDAHGTLILRRTT